MGISFSNQCALFDAAYNIAVSVHHAELPAGEPPLVVAKDLRTLQTRWETRLPYDYLSNGLGPRSFGPQTVAGVAVHAGAVIVALTRVVFFLEPNTGAVLKYWQVQREGGYEIFSVNLSYNTLTIFKSSEARGPLVERYVFA